MLLVDDSRIVRDRLLELISELPAVEVIGEAAGAAEAIRKIRRLRPDIVVLDISMPDGNGIQVLEAVKRPRASRSRIIMLTNFAHEPYRERCLELATTRDLARRFATILRERQGGDAFHAWLQEVKGCGVPRLVSFAAGLLRDEAAVIAGLTLPWSSGVVEGQNTKIKLIKRMMYGRGSFPLLRKRVMLAN